MKQLLLIIVTFLFVILVNGQTNKSILKSMIAPEVEVLELLVKQNVSSYVGHKPEKRTEIVDGRLASYIPIGQSENIWSIAGNSRTSVWAEPTLNSIVFTHRMTGNEYDNSRVAYDVSVDGGSTFFNNNFVYSPVDPPSYWFGAARIPQGGIINPVGNQNPDNAFYSYFCPVLEMSNGSWGGYAYGSNILTDTAPSNPTQINLNSGGDTWRYKPNAFTITQNGVAWYVDGNFKGEDFTYTGSLILGIGEMVDGEIAYQESLFDFLSPGDLINDIKIAFSPNGQIGYICVLSNSQSNPQPYTNFHPILLKTTDGGETWSDPIHVALGGVDGIEDLKYYWSDEIIESIEYYGPGFNRNEVSYNLGYHCDIIVDYAGNPHIAGIIALSTDEGWLPSEGTMTTWHVFSLDGGSTWDATALYDNLFFDGEIGAATLYNRPYVASTLEGDYLFFSWIDTDLDGVEANTNPNIFVVGYDSEDHWYTDVDNVTELSAHWFSAFYGSMSQYVFGESGPYYSECEIPFVFAEFTVPGDPYSPIQYWYIDGFTMPCGPLGVEEINLGYNLKVNQNYPNPASDKTSITVTSESDGIIDLFVRNSLGQLIEHQQISTKALITIFDINVSKLESGVYFCTVLQNNESVTKKMIVE